MPKPSQSLASQAGAITTPGFTMPEVFTAPQEPFKGWAVPPYVCFAHPKRADEWAKLPNPSEGDMFLIEGNNVTPLPSMKCSLVCGQQYWAEGNPAGEILRTSLREMPHPFKEHIEAVLLLYLEDRLLPVNMQFRTTKCPAAKALGDALLECQLPAWGTKSEQHKATLACQQPYCRFYGMITVGTPRTSKTSGMPYRPTSCTIHPTGPNEWVLIQKFSQDKAQEQMDAAARSYEWRARERSKKLIAQQ